MSEIDEMEMNEISEMDILAHFTHQFIHCV